MTDETKCGYPDATPYFNDFEYNGYRVIVTSGVPEHETGEANKKENCERWSYILLPLNPTKRSEAKQSNMGAMGWCVDGGTFYDVRSDPSGLTAEYNEGWSLDDCNGHSTGFGEYHYHLPPLCTDYFIDGSCSTIGWYKDGYEVRGLCDVDDEELLSCYELTEGATGEYFSDYFYNQTAYDAGDCHLDDANGYDFDDGYAYVMSTDFPYVPPYFYGTTLGSACSLDWST